MPSRHRSRERALQMIYQWDLTKATPEQVIRAYWESLSGEKAQKAGGKDPGAAPEDVLANQIVEGVASRIERIDQLIRQHAANWRLERMSTVDRSILRMAVYEMLENTALAPVIINEAIEIGRRFSEKESASFLNGVLDAIRKTLEETESTPVGQ